MSSSRRKGRPPGAPATPKPPTVTAPQAEVAEALLAETPAETGHDDKGHDDKSSAPEADAPAIPAVEAAETFESSAESAPAQHPAQDAVEAVAAEAEEAPAPEPVARETVETVEAAETTNETLAQTLAETALLPALAEAEPAEGAQPKPQTVRIGASFAFVPTLAPLTEINAKLFAFARGEGEAAIAHIQALARAKSPAEAIRLQVSEMQRAADASLTCFSEIVRSANRLNDSARWH
ncbi:phasin family protein [Methylorubrum podarium]|uniref:Phasin family protein n=1 Tax=Methylorubrum podarium TaxID=200476 RepID=A0ABV1QT64_9HYPH